MMIDSEELLYSTCTQLRQRNLTNQHQSIIKRRNKRERERERESIYIILSQYQI